VPAHLQINVPYVMVSGTGRWYVSSRKAITAEVTAVVSFPRPLDVRLASNVTAATVEPTDDGSELKLSHQGTVFHFKFDESGHDQRGSPQTIKDARLASDSV